ncbi:hypothetical protein FHY26_001075 [Xanthomonas campestris]
MTHSRPKSAMLTSKRCGRLIGKVCLRKKRSKPQALRRQRLPPRMWMKPEHLRRPLMRSEIETLHVHPMRLLLRRRQRLLLSRWLHPSTRLCRKTCARSPSLPNRSPNLSRNENPKRPKHLRLGHPRQPAQSSRGQRQWAQPWRAHLRRTLDQHHPLRPSPIKRLLRQLPQHRAHRMKWKGCAWATGGKKSSSCNIACSK